MKIRTVFTHVFLYFLTSRYILSKDNDDYLVSPFRLPPHVGPSYHNCCIYAWRTSVAVSSTKNKHQRLGIYLSFPIVRTPTFREKIGETHKNWKTLQIKTPIRHVIISYNHQEETTGIVEHPVYPAYDCIEITTSGQIFNNTL